MSDFTAKTTTKVTADGLYNLRLKTNILYLIEVPPYILPVGSKEEE